MHSLPPNGGLMALAGLFLASCASFTPQPLRVLPPVELSQACPEPAYAAKTNGELVGYALALRDALRGCNRQLEALREWGKE